MLPFVIAGRAFQTGLFAAAEAQQKSEYRDQEETQDAKAPGKAALCSDDLGAAALGTGVHRGRVGHLLNRNINRLDGCINGLHWGNGGSRTGQTTTAGRAKIAGGIGAAVGAACPRRTLRKLAAAVDADTVIRVVDDLYTTISTTHDHSSFFLNYRRWEIKLQDNCFRLVLII